MRNFYALTIIDFCYVARKLHLLQLGQGEEPDGNLAGESSRIYCSAY